jgi:hypothetical protein
MVGLRVVWQRHAFVTPRRRSFDGPYRELTTAMQHDDGHGSIAEPP